MTRAQVARSHADVAGCRQSMGGKALLRGAASGVALLLGVLALLVLGALDRPARAATTTCNSDGSVCTTTGTLSDGSQYTATINSTTNTYTFTSTGRTSGSGTFALTFSSNAVELTGSETINGVTSKIDCVRALDGTYSGQCGVIPGLIDTVAMAAAAAPPPSRQPALNGSSQAI